jgi:peptide/nickel transport system permease protein
VLSRVIYGGRVSLQIAGIAVLISGLIGVVVGLIAGYFRGPAGELLMRLADIQHSFPFIVLAIAVMSVLTLGRIEIFGVVIPVDPFWALVGILSVWGWSGYARVARAGVLAVNEREFVQSARLLGAGHRRIVLQHILPNIVSPLFVLWSFALASLIIAESSLSFLGFGVAAPTPSWGNMLADGRGVLATAWWVAIFPGLAIMATVLAVNVIGDRLRDILDPRFQI